MKAFRKLPGGFRPHLLLTLLAAVWLAGCGALSQGTPTPLPTVILGGDGTTPITEKPAAPEASTTGVVASGIVIPARQVQMAFPAGGILQAVNVRVGDLVQQGTPLAALVPSEAQLAVKLAEAQLASAQAGYNLAQASEPARSEADIAAAEAALIQAQKTLGDLKQNATLETAEAQVALTTAQQALKDAQRVRTNMDYPRANQTTIDGAQANYDLKENELQQAKDAYDRVRNLAADNPERAKALLDLSNAQRERDKALATLNWYLGKNSEQDIAEADANLALAQAQVDAAQIKLEQLKDGPSSQDISLAEARVEQAQKQLELARAQTSQERLAVSQAQLDAAQAQLELAQAQLARLTLNAPLTGTVITLQIEPGEWAAPGQPVLTLADLDTLQIQTTDLSERDVPKVEVGQPVSVFIKALNQTITGQVSEISPLADTLGGDVVYKTVIDLDEPLPGLRPGMSAEVSFE